MGNSLADLDALIAKEKEEKEEKGRYIYRSFTPARSGSFNGLGDWTTMLHENGKDIIFDGWDEKSGKFHISGISTGKVSKDCQSCKFSKVQKHIAVCRTCKLSDRRNKQINYQRNPNFVPCSEIINNIWR